MIKKVNAIQRTDASNLVKKKKTNYNTKNYGNFLKKKFTNHDHSNKFITTQEFNKLTAVKSLVQD